MKRMLWALAMLTLALAVFLATYMGLWRLFYGFWPGW